MGKNFGKTEKELEAIFKIGTAFLYNKEKLKVLKVGKPSTPKGECKTDLYILAENNQQEKRELKISIKQRNADFLENKMQLSRAKEIFGEEASDVIIQSINTIQEKFRNQNLVYFESSGKTEKFCITLGWKFELLNTLSGDKSGPINLSKSQKIDVYAGTNLSKEKKDCSVNGEVIINSGVANLILVTDEILDKDADYYATNFVNIEEFAAKEEIFFACKALNYRAEKDKWDGDRPLAIYVDWKLENGFITEEIIFNRPLQISGNTVGGNVQSILRHLNIDYNNFNELKKYLDKSIKTHSPE